MFSFLSRKGKIRQVEVNERFIVVEGAGIGKRTVLLG